MTNLSKRIMDAWLAVNPEPNARDDPSWTPWREKEYHLQYMLAIEAYESAVIQFLVPKGMTYQLGNYLFIEGGVYGQNICCESNSRNPEESLLNAILASRQEK